jgi:hypothetical protein
MVRFPISVILTHCLTRMAKAKKSRNYQNRYSRKTNIREVRQRFLILCEGTVTEKKYFENFRVPGRVIDVKGLGRDPSKIVSEAKQYAENEEYDQIWCVFDRDEWTAETFNSALLVSQNESLKVAYSNQAFELWYVLHFQYLNTAIPRSEYCEKLTKLLGYSYTKNNDNLYDDLLNKQDTAIKNAIRLLKQYEPPNPEKDNPSTTVHLLVQELNRFSS